MGQSWTYGFCEICLKNAHEEHRLVLRTVESSDGSCKEQLYVCTRCGSTRKL